jgi:hypothetical protein
MARRGPSEAPISPTASVSGMASIRVAATPGHTRAGDGAGGLLNERLTFGWSGKVDTKLPVASAHFDLRHPRSAACLALMTRLSSLYMDPFNRGLTMSG